MKTHLRITIIIGIIVLGYLKFYGETYIPTLGDTNTWKIVKQNGGFTTKTYHTNGTTTLIDSSMFNNDTIEFKNVYIDNYGMEAGYIRDDTIKKILYWTNDMVIKNLTLPVFILCDFSMQENDSIELYDFSIYDFTNLGFYNLDSIRFVSTQVGQKKIYYLSSKNLVDGIIEHPVWVEGVGPIGDLMHPGRSPIEHNFGAVSCAYRNDVQTYISQHAIDFGDCDIFTDIQDLLTNHLEVYPNPVKEILNICTYTNEINELFLYDNLGQNVLNKKIKGKGQINLKDLNAGLYYLKIFINEQPIIRKIIIEK